MAAPTGSNVIQAMLKRLAEDERRGNTAKVETVGTMAPVLAKRAAS